MVEAAIGLTPDNETAWSYKTNLLLEMSKLAEMDQNPQLKTEYSNQSNAARLATEELMKRKADSQKNEP